jgi:hypothetical protein
MRGPIRTGLLAVSLCCLFALIAGSASATTAELLDKKEGNLLRDVGREPKNQPDAGEFVNNGTVELVTTAGTIKCTEIEFGTTVVKNPGVTLGLPFGVAEADNCSVAGVNVPTLFDTTNEGAVGTPGGVVASVTVEKVGAEFIATLHNLKFSQKVPLVGGTGFCTGNLNGLTGVVRNAEGALVEEKTPNLNVTFTKVKVPIENAGAEKCPKEGELTANFFLETPSTETDTAFIR